MNVGQPIRTTAMGEINALAFQDIKVWRCDSQIRDMLRQHSGDFLPLCFARPVANRGNGSIDWYSPLPGAALPLPQLPLDQREKITARLREAASEIENLSETLIQSGDPLKVTRGNILKRALIYPDDSYIYAIGEQPIITAWGFTPGAPEVEGAKLTRIRALPGSSDKTGPQEKENAEAGKKDRPGGGWLWWLLPLLALLLLLFLLFTSFGPVLATGGKEFFHLSGKPFMEPLPGGGQSLAELRKLESELENKLNAHNALCESSARAPASNNTSPQKPNALLIPQDAESLDFLSGRWLCETGLGNTRTGEPVKVLFNFDNNGHGSAKIIEANDQCDGPASAVLENGVLHIELQELVCKRQKISYGKSVINCENSTERQTLCKGLNYDGTSWGATFLKLHDK